jgi:hypothetical protein
LQGPSFKRRRSAGKRMVIQLKAARLVEPEDIAIPVPSPA